MSRMRANLRATLIVPIALALLVVAGVTVLADSAYLPLALRGVPTPTPSPTARPASPTPSSTSTLTLTATDTPTTTETPKPSSTPSPTTTPSVTPSPTNTATWTPSPTPTATRTATSAPAPTPTLTVAQVIDLLDGNAIIIAYDGAYLGLVSSNCYFTDSIVNRYGLYGSRYSATSISNPYSLYGSAYSYMSAFNVYAAYPPVIKVWTGYQWAILCYVSVNQYKIPRIDSGYLLWYLRTKGGCTAP